MSNFLKACLAICSLIMALASPASATAVGASGSASVFWNLDYTVDSNGDYVDGSSAVAFSGRSSLFTSSAVTTENGVASSTDSSVFSFKNTSTDLFMYWSASIEALTNASAYSTSTAIGDYYFDSNSFVSVANVSSFASTNGGARCRNNNPNSAGFDCLGYSQGFSDGSNDYIYGLLNPGESFSFELSVQSFATTRFSPVSPVPLPASGVLLGFALLAFGAARKRRWRSISASCS